jgi:hypothetical protein
MNGTAPSRKALPSRLSQDLGYGGKNGYRNENMDPRSYGSATPRTGGSREPNARIVLEGYRKDINNNFERENPRYNPVSNAGIWTRERCAKKIRSLTRRIHKAQRF